MIQLSEKQIDFLVEQLTQDGLDYLPLKEELLDHVCCAIEEKMYLGFSFQEAQLAIQGEFGEKGILQIQNNTIQLVHQKYLTMKKVSLLMLILMLSVFTYSWALQQEPPSIAPITSKFKITSDFGMRFHPISMQKKMHQGIDLKIPTGTAILATSDGIIIKVKRKKDGYGNYIIIKHDNTYQSLYAQLSSIEVKEGQKVKKGQKIGLSGNSGSSTAPHLHYEVLKNGKAVNPENYF